MIRRVSINALRSCSGKSRFGTLVATEEFPYDVVLQPSPPTPAVIKSLKLANGIHTISREYNSSVVSLKFAIIGGSRSESSDQKGAAHFLSTTAFAGAGDTSGLRLVRYLERLGASFSASADKEKIVFDLKVLPDKVEPAIVAVLTAISAPPKADYVLEELKPTTELFYEQFKGDSSAQLIELIQEAAYGETSPLGSSLYAPSLQALAVPDVLAYRSTHFVKSNIIVTANGISNDRLKEIIDAKGHLIPDGPTTPAVALAPSPYVGGDIKVRVPLSGTSHIALAFPVPSGDASKPYLVLKALLEAKIVELLICGTPFLYSFAGSSGGLLGVQVSGSASTATGYLEAIVAELKSIAHACPDISILKQKVTLNSFIALEGEKTTESLLNSYLQGLDAVSSSDVRAVTPESVSAAAASVLTSVPSYAVLGTTAGTPSYATINKLLKHP